MNIKLNDKVKMITDNEWWHKGDIGRVVEIRGQYIPYLICFDNCTSATSCDYKNTKWATTADVELLTSYSLMKVE